DDVRKYKSAITESAAEPPTKSEPASKKRSLDYIVKSGLAGGLAGCAAKSLVAPLDRVKILFQTSTPEFARYSGSWGGFVSAITAIREKEGFRGLFKGHSATLFQKFPYAAINFLAYEQIRAIIIPTPDKKTPLRQLLSGSLAGSASILFTYPLDLIRVRLAIETRSHRVSWKDVCLQIYHEHDAPLHPQRFKGLLPHMGLTNFYRGFGPTILGMIPYAGMSFFTHEVIGDWLRSPAFAPYTVSESRSSKHPGRPQLVTVAELFAGGLAGVIAQTASYPLEVLRRRMQVGGHRLGMAQTCRKMWSEKGFRGFYVGMTIGYIKVVPLVATSFLVYERLKWAMGI
ncbi:Mitochondrial carrier protein LEU5, partial [Penicillium atrosanguineum]